MISNSPPRSRRNKTEFFEKSDAIQAWVHAFERCVREGYGNDGRAWTFEALANSMTVMSANLRRGVDPETVSNWYAGATLPKGKHRDALRVVLFPDDTHKSARLELFKLLEEATEDHRKLRRKKKTVVLASARRREHERVVSQSKKDCIILISEEKYISSKDVQFHVNDKSFFISPPDGFQDRLEAVTRLDYDYASQSVSFDGGHDFSDLKVTTGLSDIDKLIEIGAERASAKVLSRFSNRHLLEKPYNKKKYGVSGLQFGVPHDEGPERAQVQFELFTTDFFTDRVMREVCWMLQERGLQFEGIETTFPFLNDADFSCLFTSLGLNADLVLTAGDPCLVMNRTAYLGNENNAFQWIMAMNEAMNPEDDPPLGKFDILPVFERGFREELGLVQEQNYPGASHDIVSVFLSKTNMELGLHGISKLPIGWDALLRARNERARDRGRESSGVRNLSYDVRALAEFIASGEKMVSYAPTLWDSLVLRGCP